MDGDVIAIRIALETEADAKSMMQPLKMTSLFRLKFFYFLLLYVGGDFLCVGWHYSTMATSSSTREHEAKEMTMETQVNLEGIIGNPQHLVIIL